MTTGRAVRLLAALACGLLLVSSAVAASWSRDDGRGGDTTPEPTGQPDASPPDDAPPTDRGAPDPGSMPATPADAEELGAERLLAAGVATSTGAWAGLADPRWLGPERPVYVVAAALEDRRDVHADVVVALRADEPMDALVLRLLPAAAALDAGDPAVTVRRDGLEVTHDLDRDGARLVVPLDPPLDAGDATLLRIDLRYRLLQHDAIRAEGGPAGSGLLAWTEEASVLGHWIPLLTLDTGPMVDVVDVAAFPAAVWSVTVGTDARLIAGGASSACPDRPDDCVWIRGVALREVAAVAYEEAAFAEAQRDRMHLRTVVPGDDAGRAAAAHRPFVRSYDLLRRRLGPLAWPSIEIAWVPLRGSAAGMEFPGLVLMDLAMLETIDGGFGEFVVAHEVAHQWFEALVGSGSLSAPVVDESIAQYLAYLYWAETHGQSAAERLADALFLRPYEDALREGMEDAPPARPAEEFADDRELYTLVYGRAALAWIAAEQEVGRSRVVALLAGLVGRHGLGFLDARTLVDDAHEHEPGVAAVLERWWFEPATPPMPPLDRGDAPAPRA